MRRLNINYCQLLTWALRVSWKERENFHGEWFCLPQASIRTSSVNGYPGTWSSELITFDDSQDSVRADVKIGDKAAWWISRSLLRRLRELLHRQFSTFLLACVVLLPSVGSFMEMGGAAKDLYGLMALVKLKVLRTLISVINEDGEGGGSYVLQSASRCPRA